MLSKLASDISFTRDSLMSAYPGDPGLSQSDGKFVLSRCSDGVERPPGYQIHQKSSQELIYDVFEAFRANLESLGTESRLGGSITKIQLPGPLCYV